MVELVTTQWWLLVLAGTVAVSFAAGFIAHAERALWLRARAPYVREFDLTHTSRGVR